MGTRNLETRQRQRRSKLEKPGVRSSENLRKHHKQETKNRAAALSRLSAGCLDCGEKDLHVLEFDHRDPSKKLFDVQSQKAYRSSTGMYRRELDKCDVVCANDHRRRTKARRTET